MRAFYTSEVIDDWGPGRRYGAYKGMKVEVPALFGTTGYDPKTLKQFRAVYYGMFGVDMPEDCIKRGTRIRRVIR